MGGNLESRNQQEDGVRWAGMPQLQQQPRQRRAQAAAGARPPPSHLQAVLRRAGVAGCDENIEGDAQLDCAAPGGVANGYTGRSMADGGRTAEAPAAEGPAGRGAHGGAPAPGGSDSRLFRLGWGTLLVPVGARRT